MPCITKQPAAERTLSDMTEGDQGECVKDGVTLEAAPTAGMLHH